MSIHALIQHSINKWEFISTLSGKEFSLHYYKLDDLKTCTLCEEFNHLTLKQDCVECPVFMKSNAPFCQNTPYENLGRPSEALDYELWKTTVLKEVEFLKTVLNGTTEYEILDYEEIIKNADVVLEKWKRILERSS